LEFVSAVNIFVGATVNNNPNFFDAIAPLAPMLTHPLIIETTDNNHKVSLGCKVYVSAVK
jgi:hypothetical protein